VLYLLRLVGMISAACLAMSCSSLREGGSSRAMSSSVPTLMEQALVPGMQVATIRRGRISSIQSFGVRDVASGAPVTDDTVFEAASLGKPLFAYGVLRLVSAGRMDLDAPVGRYLPGLEGAAATLTPRQLLSHTAGLPNERGGKGGFAPDPGLAQRFSYSGEGYRLLQMAVETITGKPLNDYMKDAVFEPLRMANSSYVWREDYAAKKAFGHGFTGVSAGRNRITEARAPSSLETTAADYARFLIAVVNGTGLDAKIERQMLQPQTPVQQDCVVCLGKPAGPKSSTLFWGLGWGIAAISGGPTAWHWGDNQTMQSYAAIALDGSRGVVIFANSANGHSIMPRVAAAALGIEAPGYAWLGSYQDYEAPPRRLMSKIVRQGLGALGPDDLALPRPDLLLVAQRLASGDRPVEAAALMERLVANGSATADEYALLADARRRAGREAEAREAAAAALRLQPGHRVATDVIRKIEMAERKVPPERLAQYAGRYSTPFGPMEIASEGGRLIARLQDQPPSPMLPTSDRAFLIENMDLPIEFVRGPDGQVTHAQVQAGGTIRLPRMD
jgi:CubicO group peptidase (beta-lactamase class C family)